jgi:hypothetical protein
MSITSPDLGRSYRSQGASGHKKAVRPTKVYRARPPWADDAKAIRRVMRWARRVAIARSLKVEG